MKLYICEKPSQGRDIAKVLGATQYNDGYQAGNGAIVTWCFGHMMGLAPPETYSDKVKPWRLSALPVVPDKWIMQENPSCKKQLSVIKKLVKSASHIVIATDADREGESIAREILDDCGYQGHIERLWLSALDDASIKKALAALRPGESTEALYQAALGRSRADWLIGMNMTMAATASFSHGEGVLSVGRVQTPTLQLVVTRDLAIEKFTVSDFYEVQGNFITQNQESFVATWQVPDDEQDASGHCIKREVAENVCAMVTDQAARVSDFKEQEKNTQPPLCLSLSTMQKLASSQFGFGAKETLKLAQNLYEKHKASSYPRTDCGYLPISQHAEAVKILDTLKSTCSPLTPIIEQCDTDYRSPTWNDKKITAHHGIIPIDNAKVDVNEMSEPEKKLFGLICRYYIAQFLGVYTYAQRQVTVVCQSHNFHAVNNTALRQGWKLALQRFEKKEEAQANDIPSLTVDEQLTCIEGKILAKKTKPPARYTEGTLIAAMKNVAKEVDDKTLKKVLKDTAGIGTEATRADTIEILLKREYVKKEKKYLISTPRGRTLLEKLPMIVKNPATTAEWEQTLSEIALGQGELDDFIIGQKTVLNDMLSTLKEAAQVQLREQGPPANPCPKCQASMQRRKGKKGFFWGCSAYPDCTMTLQDVDGKPVMRKPQVLSEHDCPSCNQHKLVKRDGKTKPFWGCSGYPKCKATYFDQEGTPNFTTTQNNKGSKPKSSKATKRIDAPTELKILKND